MRRTALFLTLVFAGPAAGPAQAASIHQLAGKAGCFEMRGERGCVPGNGTQSPSAVAVAPDGANVYVAGGFEDFGALLSFRRNRSTGALTQLPGKHGCISNDTRNGQAGLDPSYDIGTKGRCADGRGLAQADDLVIAPDGRTIYVLGTASFRRDGDSIAVFRRDPATGWVRQIQCFSRLKSKGCHATPISEPQALALTADGTGLIAGGVSLTTFSVGADGRLHAPVCRLLLIGVTEDCPGTPRDSGIFYADDVVVSPDGATVYAATGDFFTGQLVAFARDLTTGALTRRACFGDAPDKAPPCGTGRALDWPRDVAISPDGAGVYVAAAYDQADEGTPEVLRTSAISAFAVSPFGQLAGEAGCVLFRGADDPGCQKGRPYFEAQAITVTPDGRHAIAGFLDSGAVALLARNTVTQALTPVAGKGGCVADRSRSISHRVSGCNPGRALFAPLKIAVSADGRNAYLASDDGIAAFALR